MNSVQTKEIPTGLASLMKAKGQLGTTARVQSPVATIVENQHMDGTVTPAQPPEEPALEAPVQQVTPAPAPEPEDTSRESSAYRELKQYHDKTVYELRQDVRQLKEALTQASVKKVELPKTKEELDAFKEQNRYAFDIMRTIVLDELSNDSSLNEVKNRIEEVNKAHAELKEKEAFRKLLEEHPDALEIRKSPAFAKWFNEQPEDIKNILSNSTDIKAVAKQLTLYKLEVLGINPKEKKKVDSKQREDNSIGVDVKGRTEITAQKKIWTGTEIQAICSDYNKWLQHKDEIDLARRENRVDMSK